MDEASNHTNNNAGDKNKRFHAWSEKDITVGESIAQVVTRMWNSQKNPGKIYIRGYRVHHGAIGLVGALACAFFNKPTAFGFFKHLMDDDINDWQEWFAGEKLSSNAKATSTISETKSNNCNDENLNCDRRFIREQIDRARRA